MGLDSRHRWIAAKVAETFGISNAAQVEKVISSDEANVSSLFEKDGKPCVAFSFEAMEKQDGASGEWKAVEKPTVRVGFPEHSHVANKVIYFVRANPKGVSDKNIEADLTYNVLAGNALSKFRTLIEELYLPVLQ
jgi:hypothetical protein